MKTPIQYFTLPLSIMIFLLSSLQAYEQESQPLGYKEMVFTTQAYREEALRLLIIEANKAAQELNLPEQLPIIETNLIEVYISPPRLGRAAKTVGMISTSNYVYSVAAGNKLSLIARTSLEKRYAELKKDYLWPVSKMDTNAAYQDAIKILNSASIDARTLNQDCDVQIKTYTPEGKTGAHFVPVYWVYWAKRHEQIPVASVELFEPTKTLMQLRIKDPAYILRTPLLITNFDFLLSQTNSNVKNTTHSDLSNPTNASQ
jgi:hypothetical protein